MLLNAGLGGMLRIEYHENIFTEHLVSILSKLSYMKKLGCLVRKLRHFSCFHFHVFVWLVAEVFLFNSYEYYAFFY